MFTRGRQVMLDIVVEAPHRFTEGIRAGAEASLGAVPGSAIRLRDLCEGTMIAAEVIAVPSRIAMRGSQVVCLKARDTPRCAMP